MQVGLEPQTFPQPAEVLAELLRVVSHPLVLLTLLPIHICRGAVYFQGCTLWWTRLLVPPSSQRALWNIGG